MEKAGIKRTYENDEAYAHLMIEDIEIAFLNQFIGNRKRLGEDAYEALKMDIAKNGLTDPLYLIVGKEDKKVKLGEGNHRFHILKELGCAVAPVVIEVRRTLYHAGGFEPRYYEYVNPLCSIFKLST